MIPDKGIPLNISEADILSEDRQLLEDTLHATRQLGPNETVSRSILDLLPSVIANRIEQIIPKDFELAEIEIKFDIQGKLFGSGIGGDVVAKLRKKTLQ